MKTLGNRPAWDIISAWMISHNMELHVGTVMHEELANKFALVAHREHEATDIIRQIRAISDHPTADALTDILDTTTIAAIGDMEAEYQAMSIAELNALPEPSCGDVPDYTPPEDTEMVEQATEAHSCKTCGIIIAHATQFCTEECFYEWQTIGPRLRYATIDT